MISAQQTQGRVFLPSLSPASISHHLPPEPEPGGQGDRREGRQAGRWARAAWRTLAWPGAIRLEFLRDLINLTAGPYFSLMSNRGSQALVDYGLCLAMSSTNQSTLSFCRGLIIAAPKALGNGNGIGICTELNPVE